MSEVQSLLDHPVPSDGWSDDDLEFPHPLERAIVDPPKPQPARRVVVDALANGVAEEAFDELAMEFRRLFPFSPEVRFGEDSRVYITLPELGIYGSGADLDSASWCLVEEVLDYVSDWEKDLQSSPIHAQRKGWVRVVQTNRTPERLFELLFG